MTTIAHMSDLHLDGTADRRTLVSRALQDAWRHRPDHLVITGDVTASGKPEQAWELSKALSGWPTPVTVVAGNHDGRLGGFTSQATDLGDCLLVPVDTRAPFKSFGFQALGRVGARQMQMIEEVTRSPARPVVLAMHHGPQLHPLHVFDGLVDRATLTGMLRGRPWTHILCGHDHRCLDIGQVRVAPSVAHHPDPVRVYKVQGTHFAPAYQSSFSGVYFT